MVARTKERERETTPANNIEDPRVCVCVCVFVRLEIGGKREKIGRKSFQKFKIVRLLLGRL